MSARRLQDSKPATTARSRSAPTTRQVRGLREHLRKLSASVSAALAHLDREMDRPSTPDRGRRIARICNALDVANDLALHFGLGVSFRKISLAKDELRKPKTLELPEETCAHEIEPMPGDPDEGRCVACGEQGFPLRAESLCSRCGGYEHEGECEG